MTGAARGQDDFDLVLTAWLQDGAPPSVPDGLLERVVATTASAARRPSWWAPGGVADILISRRSLGRALALAATIAALTLATVALVTIGSRPQVPLPPGRPGWIVAAQGGEVQLLDATGTVRHRLPTGSYPGWGTWSRDGGRLAYVSDDQAGPILVIRDGNLIEVARVVLPAGADPMLNWSPDGTSIAFVAGTDRGSRIYVVKAADGAVPVPISDPGLQALRPSWSPDGTLIAFRGGEDIDQQALYVMRRDGTGVTRLSQGGRAVEPYCGFPWTPDARSIVFSTGYNGIWVVNRDGANERQVTAPSEQAYCASISPDGTRIAAMIWLDTGKYVVVMALDGSQRVTPNGPLYDSWPVVWSPDGRSMISNSRVLDGSPNPRVVLDPEGIIPARTLFSGEAIVVDWQRLPP